MALHKGQFAQHAGVGAFVFANGGKATGAHQPAFVLKMPLGVRAQAGEAVGKRLRVGGVVQFVHQGDEFAMGGVHAVHPQPGEGGFAGGHYTAPHISRLAPLLAAAASSTLTTANLGL